MSADFGGGRDGAGGVVSADFRSARGRKWGAVGGVSANFRDETGGVGRWTQCPQISGALGSGKWGAVGRVSADFKERTAGVGGRWSVRRF